MVDESKSSLSNASSYEEMAEFWDTHSLADYHDQTYELEMTFVSAANNPELEQGIFKLQLDLQEYESQHQMSSATFYEQFSQGQLDDREAFVIWAGLYEMLLENKVRLMKRDA